MFFQKMPDSNVLSLQAILGADGTSTLMEFKLILWIARAAIAAPRTLMCCRDNATAHYYSSTQSNNCRFRYLPGVVQEQRWNKQQVPKLTLSRQPRTVFSSAFTLQQAIDSLIKKSGSKDSTSFLLCIPIITLTFIDSACRSGSSPALLAAMKVTRYQSAKVSRAVSGLLEPRSHVLLRSNVLTANG